MGKTSPSPPKPKTFKYPNVAGVPYQKAVAKAFSRYTYHKPDMIPGCVSRSPPPFANHQNFVRNYLADPSYPFGGLFLYHAAGTGKTCAAATIMSRFLFKFLSSSSARKTLEPNNEWRVLWVTRRTLKPAVLRALFYDLCLPELRSLVLDNSTEMFGTKVGKEKMKRLRHAYAAYLKGAEEGEELKSFRRRYVKKLPQQNVISYGDFVRVLAKSRTPTDLGLALAHNTDSFMHGSSAVRSSAVPDPLHKTLVVIDEAHNLYNMTDFNDADFVTLHTPKYRPRFMPELPPGKHLTGLQVIEAAIWSSFATSQADSVLVVPLTATPMPSSPTDLLRLLNLVIKDPSQRFVIDTRTPSSALDHYATKDGHLKPWVPKAFTVATNGVISYFSGDKDPRYFAMKKWGQVTDVSISQVTMEALYKCKDKNPLKGGDPAKGLIQCYRRVAAMAGVRGKMCEPSLLQRTLAGESKAEWEARETARRAYRARKEKAWLAWLAKRPSKRGPFVAPPKPAALTQNPTRAPNPQTPAAAYASIQDQCNTAYSFVLDSKAVPFTWKLLKESLPVYAPKYAALFKTIHELDRRDLETHGKLFKHCVYCDTSGGGEARAYGSKLAASIFVAKGYAMGHIKGSGRTVRFVKPSLVGPPPLTPTTQPMHKSFAVLSSSRIYGSEPSDSRTRATLAAFNAPANAHGQDVRFILIDDSYKEGIDLYDVKYFHFMEPPLSTATLRQAVARITRRCGSRALPYGPQGWVVDVFMYRSRVRGRRKTPDGNPYITVYSVVRSLFDKETLRSFRLLDAFENLAMGNAVDRLLNEAVVNFKPRGAFINAIEAGTEIIEGKVPASKS